jgi:DNA invertase Pin-like site-specific DNA recombinase
MGKRPKTGRGLFYTRDSGGEHETTPGEYVRWCQRQTKELGVTFAGTPEQIEAMILNDQSRDGDIFLDYKIQGHLLRRPGLDALFNVATSDLSVTHVFIPCRARFARPEDPSDGMKLESTLRNAGITLVFMDKTLAPTRPGKRDIGESIVAMMDYDRAGQERRDLAQKMIYAQLNLAKLGFSTGGRPPFGFRRWLIGPDGSPVRQLTDGEYVKKAGHHVIWLPGPEVELALIRRILAMLETFPASRVAAILTAEGIRSPDADRQRTDRGVKHFTSGVWHQTTITNIARNPLLLAVVEYGRRSMGDQLRFSTEGPRELEDADRGLDNKPKVVINPESTRIKAPARFESIAEPERHQRLLDELDRRGRTQRGKPRSRDPERNPLGGRMFDMSCGWPMYRQPIGESFRYLCGLYQQSHASQCKRNHVDGMLATRFLFGCIRQKLIDPEKRQKLEHLLRAIAKREASQDRPRDELAAKNAELRAIRTSLNTIGRNLARAEGEDQYRAISDVFNQTKRQEIALAAEIQKSEQTTGGKFDPEAEVEAAIAGLDDIAKFTASSNDLGSVGQLFARLNARLFFRFKETPWKKRIVNKVASGVVTFGVAPPPVPLYEGPTGRRQLRGLDVLKGANAPALTEAPGCPGQATGGEGESLGNVNRGERI